MADSAANGRYAAEFRYEEGWLKSPRRFTLDPESLPLSSGTFSGFNLNPPLSVFNDALPDRWVRALLLHGLPLSQLPTHFSSRCAGGTVWVASSSLSKGIRRLYLQQRKAWSAWTRCSMQQKNLRLDCPRTTHTCAAFSRREPRREAPDLKPPSMMIQATGSQNFRARFSMPASMSSGCVGRVVAFH